MTVNFYPDEITATNLLAAEKLTAHHLLSTRTYGKTKTKKKQLQGFLSKLFAFIVSFVSNLETRDLLGLAGSLLVTVGMVFSSSGWPRAWFASAGAETWALLGTEALHQEFGLC